MATAKKAQSSRNKKRVSAQSLLPTVITNSIKKATMLEESITKAEEQWEKQLQTVIDVTKKQVSAIKGKLKTALAKEKEAQKKLTAATKQKDASKNKKGNTTAQEKSLKKEKEGREKIESELNALEKQLKEAMDNKDHSKARKKTLSDFKKEWSNRLKSDHSSSESSTPKKNTVKKSSTPKKAPKVEVNAAPQEDTVKKATTTEKNQTKKPLVGENYGDSFKKR